MNWLGILGYIKIWFGISRLIVLFISQSFWDKNAENADFIWDKWGEIMLDVRQIT